MSTTGPGENTTGTSGVSDAKRALLEARLDRRRTEAARRNRITAVPRTGPLQTSDQQRYLWLLHQLAPDRPVYNVPFALRLRGRLDTGALAEALRRLVDRHESLRTRFGSEHGVPYQVVDAAPAEWPLPVTELSHLPDADAERRAQEAVVTYARAPFDLEAGPLFRTELLRLASDEHILVLCMHHIVTDGWSVGVITKELAVLYGGGELPEFTVHSADHAAWQRNRLAVGDLNGQIDYWRRTLEGVPTVDFPADRARPSQPTWAGTVLEARLPDRLGADLRDWARAERFSPLAVLQAGFLVVLSRYTGQEDVAIGSTLSGRTRSELEPLVGFFANTLVLRTSTAGDPTFRELVGRCQDTVLGALAHQDVPFGTLVENLHPDRMPGRNPLFQISFTLLGDAMVGEFGLGGLTVEPVPVENGTARFDLAFQVNEAPDGRLRVWLEYSTELFERDRMERLVGHFRRVLEQGLGEPGGRVGRFELLDDAERELVLRDWNPEAVSRAEDGLLLHELAERWAGTSPETEAVRFNGDGLTYGELNERADQLAGVLRSDFAVGPGVVVGLLLDRGFELPIAQLAVLKAGGAWLPLDPAHPAERLAGYIEDARARVVVTVADLSELLPAETPRLRLDDSQLTGGSGAVAGGSRARPDDLAYVIYTSGSTGTPKGVMISHRAAVGFVTNAIELFELRTGDRVLQFANPAFDVSIFDIYAALGSGATIIASPREHLLDPDALQELMRHEHVTVADLPPAVLRLLNPESLPDLRALFVGLEAFPAELVNRWVGPQRDFHNGYGPTEATVACVDYKCPPHGIESAPPIGRAMPNHRAYVLDQRLRPVPIGVAGELYMAGTGLARGYLGRPDLTAERFLPDPFSPTGERMYRTGDLVRWRHDGNLEFLGRADRQIKIRGLRIEPAEIEHALAACTGVRQGVVIVHQPGTPDAKLIGYLVPEPGHHLDTDHLRTHLMDHLPLHMVPAQLIPIDTLPLTPSGKLDHTKLPEPEPAETRAYTPPSGATQRALAELWAQLLDVPLDRIGAHDDFFDLGGNSLQVTRLISRIHDTFKISVTPRELFVHSVLRELARRIDDEPDVPAPRTAAAGQGSPLVPIRATGSRPPLFLVHAVGGSIAPYVPLARNLDPRIPVYGLEHVGLGGARPAASGADPGLTAIAESYLGAVRDVWPAGPYHLGGWSLGGAVALEMAALLRADGEEVSLLALFDTGVPPMAVHPPDDAELLTAFARDLAGLEGTEPPALDPDRLRRMPAGSRIDTVLAAVEEAGLIPAGTSGEVRSRVDIFLANARAYHTYRPTPYGGRITLFSAEAEHDDQLGWWRVFATGGLGHHVVPGTHHTMLRHPNLPVLARAQQRCLDDGQDHDREQ